MSDKMTLLKAAVIVLAVLAVYFPATRAGFVWDDHSFLGKNEAIKQWSGLPAIWSGTSGPDYLPVTLTSLWLEWRMWGAWAYGYHVSNILLHALAAILLWRVFKRLTLPAPWAAALLFAVHPVTVASVVWITERKNTLSMVFYAASLLIYLRFDSDGGKRRYGISLALFALALLSKASVVMLPVVLLGCAWWRRQKVSRNDLLRALPFFALSGIIGIVTIWFQEHRAIGAQTFSAGDPFMRLAPAGWAVWFYLSKLLLPLNLHPVYGGWDLEGTANLSIVPMLLLVALFGVLLHYRKRWARPVLFGLGYFVVTLLPVLGLHKFSLMRLSLVTDHLQYAAMIGPIALATGLVAHGLKTWRVKSRAILGAALAVPVVVLGLMTWHHVGHYLSEQELWLHMLSRYPDSWVAHYNLGNVMLEEGRHNEALPHLQKAVALKPRYSNAMCYTTLGDALSRNGDLAGAETHYKKALLEDATYVGALVGLASLLLEQGHVKETEILATSAVYFDPQDHDAHIIMAKVLLRRRQYNKAMAHCRKALALKPFSGSADLVLGEISLSQGKLGDATRHFFAAASVEPDLVEAYARLGDVCLMRGRERAAVESYQRALRLEPDLLLPLLNLSMLYSEPKDPALRNPPEALRLAQRACALTARKDPAALNTLGAAHAAAGNFKQAAATAQEALALAVSLGDKAAAKAIRSRLDALESGRLPERTP